MDHGLSLEMLMRMYKEGGFWMHPIGFVGALTFSVVIYRAFFLMLYNCNGSSLHSQVSKLVISGQIDRAVKFCNARSPAILAKVLRAGLTRWGDKETVQASMEETVIRELPKTTKQLDFLATLANLATLLGLLGTIIGLITAFHVVADAPPDKKSELLGSAIAIALNATAFGLFVAIPGLFAHGVLVTMADKIAHDVESYSVALLNLAPGHASSSSHSTPRRSFADEDPRSAGTQTSFRPLPREGTNGYGFVPPRNQPPAAPGSAPPVSGPQAPESNNPFTRFKKAG